MKCRPSRRNANAPKKLDFPEPLAPITILIGRNSSGVIEAMLLKP